MDKDTANTVVKVGDSVKSVLDDVGKIFGPTRLVTDTVGGLWEVVKRFLPADQQTPEKAMEIQAAMTPTVAAHQERMEELFNDQMRIKADVIKTEILSGDKYISHTRPSIQRQAWAFLMFCYGGMGAISYIKEGTIKVVQLPTELIVGIFGLLGFYIWSRTKEKSSM